ncbi:tetratricopeptide repeat protein [bacterium]|nr:tetratricopeptide repeat protein [bacterium]
MPEHPGKCAYNQGRYDEAKEVLQESLAIFRKIGDRRGIANVLNILAAASIQLGRPADAPGYIEEALSTASDIGAQKLILESLITTGILLVEARSTEGGMRNAKWMMQIGTLLYAAQHHAEQIGYVFDPMEQEMLDEGLKKVQGRRFKVQGKKGTGDSGQGTVELEQLEAQACAMSLDELVAYALAALAELE